MILSGKGCILIELKKLELRLEICLYVKERGGKTDIKETTMEHVNDKEKVEIDRERRLFSRILGLFFIFYGFMAEILPLQYGMGLPAKFVPLSFMVLILFGIYLCFFWLNPVTEAELAHMESGSI
jgi:hypothetical protein